MVESMTQIKCKTNRLIIDSDGRLWPCCWVSTQLLRSKYVKSLGSSWNDTKKHKVEEILSHEAFTEHFNEKGWQSPNPDPICKAECSQKP